MDTLTLLSFAIGGVLSVGFALLGMLLVVILLYELMH